MPKERNLSYDEADIQPYHSSIIEHISTARIQYGDVIEPPTAYAFFLEFLKLPLLSRNIGYLALSTGKDEATLASWQKKYYWKDRAAIYDAEQFQKLEDAKRDVIIEIAKEHGKDIREIKTKGLNIATNMMQKAAMLLERVDEKTQFKVTDIPRLAEAAVKVSRGVLDLPTHNIPTLPVEEIDETTMSRDQLLVHLGNLAEEEKRLIQVEGEM